MTNSLLQIWDDMSGNVLIGKVHVVVRHEDHVESTTVIKGPQTNEVLCVLVSLLEWD